MAIIADVCVYGGTAGGVIAAVTAAKLGRSVVLIEPGRHLGGMTTGGLGHTDFGNKSAIGGLSRDFYRRLGKVYNQEEAWSFEPAVAERVVNEIVAEHKDRLRVLTEHRLAEVDKRGGGRRIERLLLERVPADEFNAPGPADAIREHVTVEAAAFIDAGYEGDLMAAAGVDYAVGRESVKEFDEPLNGIRAQTPQHQFKAPVDPYVRPGEPDSGLIDLIQDGDGGTPGDGDRRVQAYNFRLCLTNNADNRLPLWLPKGYDPERYEVLARHVEALAAAGQRVTLGQLMKIDRMPNAKTDINNNGAVSTDFIGANYDYPDGDYATRRQIWHEHAAYVQGLLHFLATSERVPDGVREEMRAWGSCRDEFTDTDGFPHQLYVREARRMRGRYVVTQADCEHRRTVDDSVGLGAYNMDSHNCQRVVQPDRTGSLPHGVARNEGDVQVSPAGPYPVGYRAITPEAGQCENLLVPVCMSATHIAYGSIRMEPVFMVLGQSAAVAACMAVERRTSVQDVDVAKLQQRLLEAGQVLAAAESRREAPAAGAIGAGGIDPASLPGIVIDEADAKRVELIGPWQPSSGPVPGFIGAGYVHDGDAAKGECLARFTATAEAAGEYDVRLAYTAHPNRATAVAVTVKAGAEAPWRARVNQRETPPVSGGGGGGGFVSLGTVRVAAGEKIVVEISNRDTDGHVIADAVQVVRAGG